MSTERNAKFEALLDYLKRTRGFDFLGYKRSTLERRVLKRMHSIDIAGYVDYMDYLEVHPEEFVELFNTILINVTAFFRDQATWDYLAREVLPRILADKPADEAVRVWSAGCASGEEVYTVAILLAEALGPEAFRQRAKIYATDVDEEALAQARQASFGQKSLQSLEPELQKKYFESVGDRWIFRPDLRRSVIFGRHDLLQDAPISRLDLLVCRNTLMYFNAEAQAKVLSRFHFAIGENGFLFLGKAETLLTHANLFVPVKEKNRIFVKTTEVSLRDRMLIEAEAVEGQAINQLGGRTRLQEVAFDATSVAQVVVDLNGNLALANASARALLSLGSNDLGRSLQDLEFSYRPAALRSPIEEAYAQRRPVKLANVERHFPDGNIQYLEVQVAPLQGDDDTLLGVSITFEDLTQRQKMEAEVHRIHQELDTASEKLQTTNEELQSTNEELETMNEELQSTNEELETMNTELHQRTVELDHTNAFLKSILGGLRSGVIVVDRQLVVLLWNRQSEDLWGLRTDEVVGQPLLSLDIGLPVEQLPFQAFLAGKADCEEVTLNATTRRGKTIGCHITCTPFLGTEGERQGVVLLIEETKDARA